MLRPGTALEQHADAAAAATAAGGGGGEGTACEPATGDVVYDTNVANNVYYK